MQLDQVVLMQGVTDVAIDLLVVDTLILEELQLAVEVLPDRLRILTEVYALFGACFRLQGSLRITRFDFAGLDLIDELTPRLHVLLRLTEEYRTKLLGEVERRIALVHFGDESLQVSVQLDLEVRVTRLDEEWMVYLQNVQHLDRLVLCIFVLVLLD